MDQNDGSFYNLTERERIGVWVPGALTFDFLILLCAKTIFFEGLFYRYPHEKVVADLVADLG